MLIIDTFLYDGDTILVERLKTMYPYVDFFYMVEAAYTFSGKKKPFLYSETAETKAILEPYMDKVIIVTLPEFPEVPMNWIYSKISITSTYNENFEAWWREAYQRSFIFDCIRKDLKDHEYVLIAADVDEIVAPHLLKSLKEDYRSVHPVIQEKPVFMTMYFYYYSWKWVKSFNWTKPFVVHSNVLEKLYADTQSPTLLNDIRVEMSSDNRIPNSGWHLSYFMTADEIARKIEHFSHTELDREHFKVREWVQKCIEEGLDVFKRPTENCIPSKGIPYYLEQ